MDYRDNLKNQQSSNRHSDEVYFMVPCETSSHHKLNEHRIISKLGKKVKSLQEELSGLLMVCESMLRNHKRARKYGEAFVAQQRKTERLHTQRELSTDLILKTSSQSMDNPELFFKEKTCKYQEDQKQEKVNKKHLHRYSEEKQESVHFNPLSDSVSTHQLLMNKQTEPDEYVNKKLGTMSESTLKSFVDWKVALRRFHESIEKLLLRLRLSGHTNSDVMAELLRIRDDTLQKLNEAEDVLDIVYSNQTVRRM